MKCRRIISEHICSPQFDNEKERKKEWKKGERINKTSKQSELKITEEQRI